VTTPAAPTLTLGGRVLALHGLRMQHARAGILEKVKLASAELAPDATAISPARLEAMIDVVYASVDDQISRQEFDGLLNALGIIAGPRLITNALGPVLDISDFGVEAKDGTGEAAGPATSTSPGSTA
jgi:hypothetical protein